MAYVKETIWKFVNYPTVKRTKRCTAICHRKILRCELDDGTVRHYWANDYNASKLSGWLGRIPVED